MDLDLRRNLLVLLLPCCLAWPVISSDVFRDQPILTALGFRRGSNSCRFSEVGRAVREARSACQALFHPMSRQPIEIRLPVWPTKVHREPLTSGASARIGLDRQGFDRVVHAMNAVPTGPHGGHQIWYSIAPMAHSSDDVAFRGLGHDLGPSFAR